MLVNDDLQLCPLDRSALSDPSSSRVRSWPAVHEPPEEVLGGFWGDTLPVLTVKLVYCPIEIAHKNMVVAVSHLSLTWLFPHRSLW